MLDTGDKVPEFTLPDQDGHDISLTGLLKDGPAILFFYPADFTPGCTPRGLLDPRYSPGNQPRGPDGGGHQPAEPGEPQALSREAQPALHAAVGREQGSHQDVRGERAAGLLGAAGHLPDGPEPHGSSGRVKAHFSIAEHEAFIRKAIELRKTARLRASVLQAQHRGLADGGHGDDVHRIEFLVAHRRHVVRVAQARRRSPARCCCVRR